MFTECFEVCLGGFGMNFLWSTNHRHLFSCVWRSVCFFVGALGELYVLILLLLEYEGEENGRDSVSPGPRKWKKKIVSKK